MGPVESSHSPTESRRLARKRILHDYHTQTQWNYGFMGFKLRSIRIQRQTRLFARFYDVASQKACFHGIDPLDAQNR